MSRSRAPRQLVIRLTVDRGPFSAGRASLLAGMAPSPPWNRRLRPGTVLSSRPSPVGRGAPGSTTPLETRGWGFDDPLQEVRRRPSSSAHWWRPTPPVATGYPHGSLPYRSVSGVHGCPVFPSVRDRCTSGIAGRPELPGYTVGSNRRPRVRELAPGRDSRRDEPRVGNVESARTRVWNQIDV